MVSEWDQMLISWEFMGYRVVYTLGIFRFSITADMQFDGWLAPTCFKKRRVDSPKIEDTPEIMFFFRDCTA